MLLLSITIILSFGIFANGITSSCVPSLCGENAPYKPHYNKIIEIHVKSGSNLTIKCNQENYLPPWDHPFVEEFRQRCDYIIQKYEEDTIENNRVLFIPKVTYAHTGLYGCTSIFKAVGYYVYVEDDSILSLSNTEIYSGDVVAEQHKIANIPCIPTSPDVKVDLYIGKSAMTQTKVDSATFNPQTGFATNDTSSVGIRIYTCKFTKGKKQEVLTSRFIVKPIDYSIPFVSLKQIQNKDRIIVQCSYDGDENLTIEWITPQKKSDKRTHRFDFKESTFFHNQTISWFTVGIPKKRDEGIYYCKVSRNEQVFIINPLYVTTKNIGYF